MTPSLDSALTALARSITKLVDLYAVRAADDNLRRGLRNH